MTKATASIVFSILFLGAAALGQSNTATSELTLDPGVKPHKKIDSIYSRFSDAYRTLDPKLVTNLYTENAFYLTPESGVDRGRQFIRNNFESFFRSVQDGGGKLAISFQIIERKVSGGLGYDVGIYTLTATNAKGQASISKGKFVVIALSQKSGDWKFQLDSYSDLPKEKK